MSQKKRANQNERSETYQRGLAARKKVLGAEYVDNALRSADAFSRDLQDYLTEHAWGRITVGDRFMVLSMIGDGGWALAISVILISGQWRRPAPCDRRRS